MAVSCWWADPLPTTVPTSHLALQSPGSRRKAYQATHPRVGLVQPWLHRGRLSRTGGVWIESEAQQTQLLWTTTSDGSCTIGRVSTCCIRRGLTTHALLKVPTKALPHSRRNNAVNRKPGTVHLRDCSVGFLEKPRRQELFSSRSTHRLDANAQNGEAQAMSADGAAALPDLDVLEDIFDTPDVIGSVNRQGPFDGVQRGKRDEPPELGLLEELLSEHPVEEDGLNTTGGDGKNGGGADRKSDIGGLGSRGASANGAAGKKREVQKAGRAGLGGSNLQESLGGSRLRMVKARENGTTPGNAEENDWSNSALEEKLRTASEEISAKGNLSELSFESLIDAGAVALFVEDGRIERLPIEEVLGEEVKAFVKPAEELSERGRSTPVEERVTTTRRLTGEGKSGTSENFGVKRFGPAVEGVEKRGETTPRAGVWRAPKAERGQRGGRRVDTRTAKAPGAWAQWLESVGEPARDFDAGSVEAEGIESRVGGSKVRDVPGSKVVDEFDSASGSDWDSDGRASRVTRRGLGQGSGQGLERGSGRGFGRGLGRDSERGLERGFGVSFGRDTGFANRLEGRGSNETEWGSDGSVTDGGERRRGSVTPRVVKQTGDGLPTERWSAKRGLEYEALSASELFGADPFGGVESQPIRTPGGGRVGGVRSAEGGAAEATAGGMSTTAGGAGATAGDEIGTERNSEDWDAASRGDSLARRQGLSGSDSYFGGSARVRNAESGGNGHLNEASALSELPADGIYTGGAEASRIGSRSNGLGGAQAAVRSRKENGLDQGLDDRFERRPGTSPPVKTGRTTGASPTRRGSQSEDGFGEGLGGGFGGNSESRFQTPQRVVARRSDLESLSETRLPKASNGAFVFEREAEPGNGVREKRVKERVKKRVNDGKERAWEAWQQFSGGQTRTPQEMQEFLASWAAENVGDEDLEPDNDGRKDSRKDVTGGRGTYADVSRRGDTRGGNIAAAGYENERPGAGRTRERGRVPFSSPGIEYPVERSAVLAGSRGSGPVSNRPGKDVWVSPKARNAPGVSSEDAAPGDFDWRGPLGRFTGVQELADDGRVATDRGIPRGGGGADVSTAGGKGADATTRDADVAVRGPDVAARSADVSARRPNRAPRSAGMASGSADVAAKGAGTASRGADVASRGADVDQNPQRGARRRDSVESLEVLLADGWGASEGADLDWVGDDESGADTWSDLEGEEDEEDEFVQPTESEWQQVLDAGAAARRARWAAQEADSGPEALPQEEEEALGDISRVDLEALSEEQQKDLLLKATINQSVRNRVQHWRDSRLKKKPRDNLTMEERGFAKFADVLPELERQKLLCQKVKAGKLVWAPCCVFYVIHHSHTEILRFFNARTRALARQWKLSYVATRALNYYMRSSCCLTLAIKNQLKSRAAAYKKFGRELTDPVTRAKFDMKTPIPKGGWDTIDADRPVGVRAVGGGYYTPEEMRVRSRMVPQPITWQVPTLEDPTMGGRWDLGVDTPERVKSRKRPEDRSRDRKFGGWSSTKH